ncbi:methylated-DNA--[protein]-cysteine S-methyltransferase [Chitinispirillales bacterium ANBcel5]|uniref:methylated-DNA--[protein]-cysteine S-methyltransferase n=1 Tax=Cellulosispirillum alkaliphilum TaxID=3039283 RepID=UPI002A53FA9C|nr:methylated-DNA--[protein]-cysteine S-methyltransferase [Chitinispirillales bacterium ANBcel5]
MLSRCVINHCVATVTVSFRHTSTGKIRINQVDLDPPGEAVTSESVVFKDEERVWEYCEVFRLFLSGNIKQFPDVPLELKHVTAFRRSVLLAARQIPWGKTVTYAQLAEKAGNKGAIRAAASALANNPFPLVIPCHRIIRSDGTLGGFLKSKNDKSILLKEKLLEREGVDVNQLRL